MPGAVGLPVEVAGAGGLLVEVAVGVGLLVEVTVGVTDVDAAAPDGEVLEGAVTVAGCVPPQRGQGQGQPGGEGDGPSHGVPLETDA